MKTQSLYSQNHRVTCIRLQTIYFICGILLLTLGGCSYNNNKTETALSHILDIYYLESANDSALALLSEIEIPENSSKKSFYEEQKTIFKAAALSKKGETTQAWNIISRYDVANLHTSNRYYFKSIKSLILFNSSRQNKAFTLLNATLNESPSDIRTLANNQRLLGQIFQSYGDYSNAHFWFLKSQETFEKTGLTYSIAINNRHIGIQLFSLSRFNDAQTHLNEAEQTFIANKDYKQQFYSSIINADMYIQKDLPSEALYYIQKAEKANLSHDALSEALIMLNRAEVDLLQKKHIASIGKIDSVIALGNDYYQSTYILKNSYLFLAKNYNAIGNWAKARENAYHCLAIIESKRNYNLRAKIYQEISKSYLDSNPAKSVSMMDSATYFLNKQNNMQAANLLKLNKISQANQNAYNQIIHKQEKADTFKVIHITVFSILIIALVILIKVAKTRKEKHKMVQKIMAMQNNTQYMQGKNEDNTYSIKSESDKRTKKETNKFDLLYESFINWLGDDDNFTRKDINLEIAAKELNTNRYYLSKAISLKNERYIDVVNKFRIDETIRIMSNQEDLRNKYHFAMLASEMGFNSQSVFFDTFRKQTGFTPAQFRNQIVNELSEINNN